MKTLEVRCCCHPEILLGYMDVQDEKVFRGSQLSFAVMEYPEEYCPLLCRSETGFAPPRVTKIDMDIEVVTVPEVEAYLAVRSTHVAEEMLDRIPTFRRPKHEFKLDTPKPTPLPSRP